MINELGMKNARAVRGRAEEHTDRYDIVTARGVAYADELFRRTVPLVKKEWTLCLYKKRSQEEDDRILTIMRQKNLTPLSVHHYHLPDDENNPRVLYVFKK